MRLRDLQLAQKDTKSWSDLEVGVVQALYHAHVSMDAKHVLDK